MYLLTRLLLRRCFQIIFYFFFLIKIGSVFAAPGIAGINTYGKNVHLNPIYKQKIAAALERYRQADDIWDVLRDEFSLPHYENEPEVRKKIAWYMRNPDVVIRAANRSAPYLYYILQQVKKRHLPAEIVLLPIVESGYNPFALSYMGASGIWQMMPGTANGLGIRQNFWYDGRRDVIASTRAALNYLSYLENFFNGNWLLAIAAYNTGEGNVLAAIKKNIRDGRTANFWALPVAQQTRDYVPSILALATILSRPDLYPIRFPIVKNAPYLAQISVGKQVNLKFAAELAGISYQTLLRLNPGFNRTVSPSSTVKIILPIKKVERFSANLAKLTMTTKWFNYKVRPGDTLQGIANRYHVALPNLISLNKTKTTRLTVNSTLLIPLESQPLKNVVTPMMLASKVSIKTKLQNYFRKSNLVVNPVTYTLQPGDTIYMVRAHDTLQSVAQRFKVDAKIIASVNKLTQNNFIEGKHLIIPTHPVAVRSEVKQLHPGDTLYMVRKGDTLERIALKFNTTAATLRLNNLINDSELTEGQKIVVPTHLRG